jgi:hypothetical protein
MNRTELIAVGICAAGLSLTACSSAPMAAAPMYSQASLPAAVQVPAGHRVVLESVGVGDITYECRDKANAPGQHEWVFAGPLAELRDRQGRTIGRYVGPPATWAASDGSAITGTQLAVAPAGDGNIPLQLVKANPVNSAQGQGVMTGISHIQRVATRGGVAPTSTCDAGAKGKREVVKYQADYIFYKPM